jgi:hypothetical protein
MDNKNKIRDLLDKGLEDKSSFIMATDYFFGQVERAYDKKKRFQDMLLWDIKEVLSEEQEIARSKCSNGKIPKAIYNRYWVWLNTIIGDKLTSFYQSIDVFSNCIKVRISYDGCHSEVVKVDGGYGITQEMYDKLREIIVDPFADFDETGQDLENYVVHLIKKIRNEPIFKDYINWPLFKDLGEVE